MNNTFRASEFVVCIDVCNAAAVACYITAGLVFGTITLGPGVAAGAIACSAAQGACMIACGAVERTMGVVVI